MEAAVCDGKWKSFKIIERPRFNSGEAGKVIQMNVTEKIGKEYERWQPRERVFISTPTGSGKTYFVLHELVPFAKETKRKILYLVNRSILKEQLEREISMLPVDERYIVKVELYQVIESLIWNSYVGLEGIYCYPVVWKSRILDEMVAGYDFVVCDECHYFLADSSYNTCTWLSFRWIQDYFKSKIRIFLSATIDDVKRYIVSDDEKYKYKKTPILGFHIERTECFKVADKEREWNYDIQRNYDHLNVNIINKQNQIVDLVCNDNSADKWLIFVDSIAFGEKLQKMIRNALDKERNETDQHEAMYKKDVVFLSAGYKNKHDDARNEVESIKNENIQSARILITTSVMDNGINIKDNQLKNLIVLADNEVEFIQMLGRLRKNENRINVFVYKYSENHFKQKINKIRCMEEVAVKYWEKAYERVYKPLQQQREIIGVEDWNEIIGKEIEFVTAEHIVLLNYLINENGLGDRVKALFYARNGILQLNPLSVCQMDHLKQFYNQIMDKFELEGEDAFVREQLRWLGKKEQEIENIISENKVTAEERSRKEVCRLFEEVIDKPLKEKDAIVFKGKVRENLLVLIQSCEESKEKQTVENSLKKLDRPISGKNMMFFKLNCKLPYTMKVESSNEDGETYYILHHADM